MRLFFKLVFRDIHIVIKVASDAGAAIFNSTVKGSVFIDSVEVVTNDDVTVSKGFTGVTTGGSNRTACG